MVLFVDDEPDSSVKLLSMEVARDGINVSVLHPRDVKIEDLNLADLVLVDYQIDSWPERDEQASLALKPGDGLALASIFRQAILVEQSARPTSFALLTAKMGALAHPWPREANREHLLASMNGLEWVFEKQDDQVADKIISLARTVANIPSEWGENETENLLNLLRVGKDAGVRERILSEILAHDPPIHDLRDWTHGISLVRWMLQRVLPYPCFLMDDIRVCARLGLDYEAFSEELNIAGSKIQEMLLPAQYQGMLRGFRRPRWWKAHVEKILWEGTNGNSFDQESIQRFVIDTVGKELPKAKCNGEPIVCYDEDLLPKRQFSSLNEVVRLRPDYWPSAAEPCWAEIVDVKDNPELSSTVDPADKALISDEV